MRTLLLAGGVGGAKLAHGFALAQAPELLTVVVNTGDDFIHWGLAISPDLDTVLYTLAGVVSRETGWGRGDETWNTLATMQSLGGEAWFRLGDRDLALHLERTRRLAAGETLSQVMGHLAAAMGVRSTLLPMADTPVRTIIDCDEGALPFQKWFVARRCEPRFIGARFDGIERAQPNAAFLKQLTDPNVSVIVIGPSNPIISIGPILALKGVRAALAGATAPRVAVSPIIGGRAVKGPAAKMLRDIALEASALTVAKTYAGLVDHFVLDRVDAG